MAPTAETGNLRRESRGSQLPNLPHETEDRVLGYAAAMGREFEFNTLMAALEMDEETLAETLEDLVHRGVFREARSGDLYLFTQEETMATALRGLSSSRLRVVHRKIAEAYEKIHPDPPPELIPEMGRHFFLGKVHDKSMLYNRYSATLARNNFSPDVAIHYLQRVREDLPALDGDHRLEEAEVLRELGDLYVATGDAMRADEMYGKSLEKVPPEEGTLRALTLLAWAEALRQEDRLDRVRACCQEAQGILEKTGHRKGLAMMHQRLSRVAYKEGKMEEGRREAEISLSLLDPQTEAREVASCYIDLGNVCGESGEPADRKLSEEYFHKAIAILEPREDFGELSRAHNNLAVLMSSGNPEGAIRELDLARAYAEKARDRRSVGWALFNSVEFHLRLGHVKEAEVANAGAMEILFKLNDKVGMQQVRLNQGILAQHQGDLAAAEAWYLEALDRAEKLGYPQDVAEMHVRLAWLYQSSGKRDKTEDELTKAETAAGGRLPPQILPLYTRARESLHGLEPPRTTITRGMEGP